MDELADTMGSCGPDDYESESQALGSLLQASASVLNHLVTEKDTEFYNQDTCQLFALPP